MKIMKKSFKTYVVILIILTLVAYSGYFVFTQKYKNQGTISIVEVSFKTEDGVTIVGDYYKSANPNSKPVILLHMLSRDRKSWTDFPNQLKEKGYSVLVIDLRGHGKSNNLDGKIINFKSFSESDFNNMVLDVAAARKFLQEQENISKSKLAIIGASIGANVALNYAAESTVDAVVLLSPGLDYRGVDTSQSIKKFKNSLLIVASEEDEYSADSSKTLFNSSVAKKELKIYNNAGHGTNMFSSTDLSEFILNWLAKSY